MVRDATTDTTPQANDVRITLRIFGNGLDPTAVSRQLGLIPSKAAKSGDVIARSRRSSRVRRASTGTWIYAACRVHADSVSLAIDNLLRMLEPAGEAFLRLSEMYKVDLSLGVFPSSTGTILELPVPLLAALSAKGIAVRLDVYDPRDEIDDEDAM